MDQADGSNALIQHTINNQQSPAPHEAGDTNTVDGHIESGGNVIQGNHAQVQINQYFGHEATSPDLESPDAAESITVQYFEPETVLIPAGSFLMGSPSGDGIPEYETPQFEVFLPAYRLGKSPVTNRQYEQFVRQTEKLVPRIMAWKGQLVPEGREDQPALGVTWNEALAYCKWLRHETGRQYSLPNEAQWEKPYRDSQDSSALAGNILEWTCTLWGEKRGAPNPKYRYPWKDDGRNTLDETSLLRVVRGVAGADDIGFRRYTIRRGQDPNDPGFPQARYGFRVAMIL